jgi:hypothetical protein
VLHAIRICRLSDSGQLKPFFLANADWLHTWPLEAVLTAPESRADGGNHPAASALAEEAAHADVTGRDLPSSPEERTAASVADDPPEQCVASSVADDPARRAY